MDFSEKELQAKTKDLNDLHNDESYPAMLNAVSEWKDAFAGETSQESVMGRQYHRRKFLLGMGATIAGGAVLAACGTSSSSSSSAVAPTTTIPTSLEVDLKVAALSASLENLGVYAYTAGISAATAGKLGAVPPAVVSFAQTAMAQHKEHAAAWNSILVSANRPRVVSTDASLTPTVNAMFAKVTDASGLAALALEIEGIAAATYLSGLSVVSSAKAISTAAAIQPVEMQHIAILNYVLGQYPVPTAFGTTTLAAKA